MQALCQGDESRRGHWNVVNAALTNIAVSRRFMLFVALRERWASRGGANGAMMQQALKGLFFIMPFLFGIGFIAPLIAALMPIAGVAPPLAMSPIGFGLLLGGAWGLYATIKGSWL